MILSRPKCAAAVTTHAQVGEYCLSRNCRLANCHKRRYTFRKVHIEPRAKTDHAEALARTYRLAGADETHDATGNKAGNLHNGNARARDRDDERIALVVD